MEILVAYYVTSIFRASNTYPHITISHGIFQWLLRHIYS